MAEFNGVAEGMKMLLLLTEFIGVAEGVKTLLLLAEFTGVADGTNTLEEFRLVEEVVPIEVISKEATSAELDLVPVLVSMV